MFSGCSFAAEADSGEVVFSFIRTLILDTRIHIGVGDVHEQIENENHYRDESNDSDN